MHFELWHLMAIKCAEKWKISRKLVWKCVLANEWNRNDKSGKAAFAFILSKTDEKFFVS